MCCFDPVVESRLDDDVTSILCDIAVIMWDVDGGWFHLSRGLAQNKVFRE